MSGRETWTVLRPAKPRHEHDLPPAVGTEWGTIVRCPCGQRFIRLGQNRDEYWSRRLLPWPR